MNKSTKRKIFSVVFAIICYAILIAWSWLPDSSLVNGDICRNDYKLFIEIWVSITLIAMVTCTFLTLERIGGKLFDWLTK